MPTSDRIVQTLLREDAVATRDALRADRWCAVSASAIEARSTDARQVKPMPGRDALAARRRAQAGRCADPAVSGRRRPCGRRTRRTLEAVDRAGDGSQRPRGEIEVLDRRGATERVLVQLCHVIAGRRAVPDDEAHARAFFCSLVRAWASFSANSTWTTPASTATPVRFASSRDTRPRDELGTDTPSLDRLLHRGLDEARQRLALPTRALGGFAQFGLDAQRRRGRGLHGGRAVRCSCSAICADDPSAARQGRQRPGRAARRLPGLRCLRPATSHRRACSACL